MAQQRRPGIQQPPHEHFRSPEQHHYKKRPGEDAAADQLLEEAVRWLMEAKGLTREAALEEAKHWV